MPVGAGEREGISNPRFFAMTGIEQGISSVEGGDSSAGSVRLVKFAHSKQGTVMASLLFLTGCKLLAYNK